MEVKFYKTTSNDLAVNKVLTAEIIKNVKWLEETDIIKPSLLLNFNPLDYNYCVINGWNRKYFIRKQYLVANNLYRIELEEDVLCSWWSKISNQNVVLARNENLYNTYLNDSEYNCYNQTFIQQKEFPNGFNLEPTILLAVSGGDE